MRLRQGDTKAAVAAYERSLAEAQTESAAVLSGLARALIKDGRATVRPCCQPVRGLGFNPNPETWA